MGGPEGSEGIQDEWVETISVWARQDGGVRAVWIYGSRARGTATPDSDLDIAIRLTGGPAAQLRECGARLQSLLAGVRADIQATCPFAGEKYVWPGVEADGRLIFEAWPGASLEPGDD